MDRDKDWTAGYVTELEYTYGYYRELSCISAAAAMEQQGVSPACSRPSAILTRSECRAPERVRRTQMPAQRSSSLARVLVFAKLGETQPRVTHNRPATLNSTSFAPKY